MIKPRRQVYSMETYLTKIEKKKIRSDADVQRLAGAWDKSMINELIVTVLTDDYIPPIILGQEESSQLWIIDGLQRSTSLMAYKYGNYKITSTVENPYISYRVESRDENGNIKTDNDGNFVWEDAVFNIKNKTYSDLPKELQERFDDYQIETVIHETCNMKRVSKLIRRCGRLLPGRTALRAISPYRPNPHRQRLVVKRTVE